MKNIDDVNGKRKRKVDGCNPLRNLMIVFDKKEVLNFQHKKSPTRRRKNTLDTIWRCSDIIFGQFMKVFFKSKHQQMLLYIFT